MNSREVILNLWYVRDEEGIIYSLRAKAYIGDGTDEAKLKFLQERAKADYLVAEPFEVPSRFHVTIGAGKDSRKMPVAHMTTLQTLGSPIALFEDAIKIIESRFPAQSELDVPQDPLVCTTPLMQNAEGAIEPRITGQVRLS